MQLARVTGPVVATRKHDALVGAKLLLAQPIDADGRPAGDPVLVVDAGQAGVGERVLIVREGRAASAAVGRRAAPVDAAVVGIVDRVDVAAAPPPAGTRLRARTGAAEPDRVADAPAPAGRMR